MDGNLSTMPLVNLLELLHAGRKSGLLKIKARTPLHLRLQAGEVVSGGILDWEGMEAIAAFDLHTSEGAFHFETGLQSGRAIRPMASLLGEWARLNDENRRFLRVIESPSRVYESLENEPPYDVFIGGRSVRGAAREWGVPLIIAMERVWTGVRSGKLSPLGRYAWFGLRIRHPRARRRQSGDRLSRLMDGRSNLGELVAGGIDVNDLRRYLMRGIQSGDLILPGRGWLLRDITWELEYASRPGS